MQQLLFIYHYYINIHLLIFVYKHAFLFFEERIHFIRIKRDSAEVSRSVPRR